MSLYYMTFWLLPTNFSSLFLLNDLSIDWCFGDLYLMYEGFYKIFCLNSAYGTLLEHKCSCFDIL